MLYRIKIGYDMKTLTRFLILALCLTASASLASAQIQTQRADAAIDYPGFLQLSSEVYKYRADRLVTLEDFNAMAVVPGTIILDTRSKAAFDQGHMKGAMHLNFSDFTDEKLAKVIGDPDTRILIYCNNNFTDNVRPFVEKRGSLALNVPTFINLYGYGYKNIYELADGVGLSHPGIDIVQSQD